MPALSNPKHEHFANLLNDPTLTIEQAHVQAGFSRNRHNAAKLAKQQHIVARREELRARQQDRHDVSVDTITQKLAAAYKMAEDEKKPGDMRGAAMDMAKLHGLLVDRSEEGKPGDFINLTEEQKLKRAKGLAKELGIDRIDGTLLTPGLADQPAEGNA